MSVTERDEMRTMVFLILSVLAMPANSQTWHLNTEPLYFAVAAPNLAFDRHVSPSLAVGFQYAALDWGANGANLSGVQAFYSRTSEIGMDSEVLKLYVGRLSPGTSLLKIDATNGPKALFEVMYGYRWVTSNKFSIAVLAGTFFTTSQIYPSVSIPVGWMF
jgi:hypothetical protein